MRRLARFFLRAFAAFLCIVMFTTGFKYIGDIFTKVRGFLTEPYSVLSDDFIRGSGLETGQVTSKLSDNPEQTIRRTPSSAVRVPGTRFDGQSLSDDFYFYRSSLSEEHQKVYDIIRSGLLSGDLEIDMTVPVSTDDIFELYQMVIFDSPEIFWAETSMSYMHNMLGKVVSIEPEYNDLVNDISGTSETVENRVYDALCYMQGLDSDIERVKFAHDYLTHNIDYATGVPYEQCAYSALVGGKTVCAGYAHAFQYLMQKSGIPCAYVIGTAGEYHAWNILCIDGEYYAMDVTWDDPVGAGPNDYFYDYFNITDEEMSQSHIRSQISECIPTAYGTAYSYENAFGGGYGGELLPEENDTDNNTSNSNSNYSTDSSEGYDDYELDWWNALDSSWEQSDWEYEDGLWSIWDEETQCYYLYNDEMQMFGCIDGITGDVYIMDPDTYEWILS